MIINFFETAEGLDKRAVQGGIYHVELLKKGEEQAISLYIGESVWIIERCGIHLYAFFENPSYFGLTKIDLEDDSLILKFSFREKIEGKKSVLSIGKYKEAELRYIKEDNPITQLSTSDNQIRNIDEKVRRVQDEMKKFGFR
ncbi:hypothetical protein [[Clostridium] fimetarium]|uniref:Uncharacterized protein n=1 Tax=[Clostridium] fimetarium TaxID=99656 RepID=A0A1I0NFX0_9FIRM|nr:hypothetical protein [[Clostridium] fimetarium]SEW00145.1 hypothetical protein SAMN05421659_10368 [[Clostridium] fimetarium]